MYIHYMHDERKIQTSTLWSVMGRLRAFFEHGVWNPDGRPYNVKRDIPEVDHALKQWQKQEQIRSSKVNNKKNVLFIYLFIIIIF